METQNENQIFLPDDYHPLASIEQIEMLLRFTNRAYNCLPDIGKNVSNLLITKFHLEYIEIKLVF